MLVFFVLFQLPMKAEEVCQQVAVTGVQPHHQDPRAQAKRHFVELIFNEVVQMDQFTWIEYQSQAFQLLMKFVHLRQQRQQPQYQPL